MVVAHFPQLKSLFWCSHVPNPTYTIRNVTADSTWPELQHLELWAYASDMELSFIIGRMKQATVLRLTNSKFESASFLALQPQLPWLKTLSITDVQTSTAAFIPTVLDSCLRLEMLVADGVLVQDLLGGPRQPWACKDSLKVLELFFETTVVGSDVEQKQQEEQDYIFERLSELQNLESLIVSPPNRWTPMCRNQPTLDFRLEKGLGRLATLTQLTHFDFLITEQSMTTAEAEWMIDHWVSLEQATGVFNQDEEENSIVSVLLYEAGIAVSLGNDSGR
ncbi:hypothetical protein EDD21DRAFT_382664 [Dissophora ornata]|nr:hypothetical protein EDD21DRAFT_382664 [Dissophora ornata]